MNELKPNCRYGHGELVKQKINDDANYSWTIPSVKSLAEGILPQNTNGAFSLNLYTCSTCGYIELHDDALAETKNKVQNEHS